MTYLPPSLPDVEVVLVAYLQTLDLPDGTIVSTEVPTTYDGSQLVARVQRIGGRTDWPAFDHPTVELSCWGPDKASAAALTDVVRLSMTWMYLGMVSSFPVPCSFFGADEINGPRWFNEDGYLPAGRYVFEVSLDMKNV